MQLIPVLVGIIVPVLFATIRCQKLLFALMKYMSQNGGVNFAKAAFQRLPRGKHFSPINQG